MKKQPPLVDDVCDGRCCAVFIFSTPLDELKARTDEQAVKLCAALEPITHDEASARVEEFGLKGPVATDLQKYKCRHWDEDTRLCTIYPDRPRMCAEYPYAAACPHCGGVATKDVIAERLESGYEELAAEGFAKQRARPAAS